MSGFEYTRRKLSKCLYLYLGETGRCGLGVFAARAFRTGDVILVDNDGDYYHKVLSYMELCRRQYSLENTFQVGIDAFKMPTGSIEDFTNHSCDPNTGIRLNEQGTIIVALRDIVAHEELTYDYSTYLNNPHETMLCRCGAAICRGVIGNFNTLPLALQTRYRALGIIGDFVDVAPEQGEVAD